MIYSDGTKYVVDDGLVVKTITKARGIDNAFKDLFIAMAENEHCRQWMIDHARIDADYMAMQLSSHIDAAKWLIEMTAHYRGPHTWEMFASIWAWLADDHDAALSLINDISYSDEEGEIPANDIAAYLAMAEQREKQLA